MIITNNRLPPGYRAISILEEIGIVVGMLFICTIAIWFGCELGRERVVNECLHTGHSYGVSRDITCQEYKP